MKKRRATHSKRESGGAFGAISRESTGGCRPGVDYRTLFELAPDGILLVDEHGHYVDANRSAVELTGYSRDELLGMRVGDLVIESERQLSEKRFGVLLQTGRTRRDRTLQRRDGTLVRVDAHAIDLGNGLFQSTIRDVSERARAEQELRRSLDAYSTLVELCGAAVLSAGADGRLTSWNAAAAELFGYTASQAVGMKLTKLIPPRFRERHLERFRSHIGPLAKRRFHRTFQIEALRRNGREVPIEISVGVGWQGEVQVFTAIVRDITEQCEMLERLNDALQRVRFHVERMPLAYIVWDRAFCTVEWNPSAERIFGYSKEEAIGRHAHDLIVPPDLIPVVGRIFSDLMCGDESSHSVNDNMRKDGTRLTCEWFNTPLRDSAGNVWGVASMAMDVTERELMEARLRNAQRLESLGVLAGGFAHDFNSSLMVILGNASLLKSVKGLPARAIEHVELIDDAGLRAKDLIQHLLTYARTGRHNPQPTSVNEVIDEAARFVRSAIGAGCTLEIALEHGPEPILADRNQLEQVILNLCMNANEAMGHRGIIGLRTCRTRLTARQAARCVPHDVRPGEYIQIQVSDTGCGMDEATKLRIFDPFFSTKADGHGLGLASVMGILRQHHGAAWIDSKVGAGTDFRVLFPVTG